MKVKLSLMLMVAVLISVPAYAQATLAGKWVGELSATDGHGVAQPVTLDLKIEGDAVSGTVTEGALEARYRAQRLRLLPSPERPRPPRERADGWSACNLLRPAIEGFPRRATPKRGSSKAEHQHDDRSGPRDD